MNVPKILTYGLMGVDVNVKKTVKVNTEEPEDIFIRTVINSIESAEMKEIKRLRHFDNDGIIDLDPKRGIVNRLRPDRVYESSSEEINFVSLTKYDPETGVNKSNFWQGEGTDYHLLSDTRFDENGEIKSLREERKFKNEKGIFQELVRIEHLGDEISYEQSIAKIE